MTTHFHRFNESGYTIPLADEQYFKTLNKLSSDEHIEFADIEIVYVDEKGIVSINREYLEKEYVTDIITFSYHEDLQQPVEATLYCCAPRIAEQAHEFGESEHREFLRVFIHGLLHLCGYNDATEQERIVMKERENYYLEELCK